jgi:hypothetical protein
VVAVPGVHNGAADGCGLDRAISTYSPVLRQADIPDVAVPWWGNRRLHFECD